MVTSLVNVLLLLVFVAVLIPTVHVAIKVYNNKDNFNTEVAHRAKMVSYGYARNDRDYRYN